MHKTRTEIIILLALLLSCAVCFPAITEALRISSMRQGGAISIELRNKSFVPAEARVKAGDSITICNRDSIFHSPFSYSRYNKFGFPKGIRLAPGACTTRVARNPTKQEIPFKIFDEIHAQEQLALTVLPTPNEEGSEDEDIIEAPVEETPPGQEGAIELRNKRFVPLEATVKDGDSVMFCNRDPFFHSPFSYSTHNRFGSPKGVRLAPGQCFTHIARNPTKQKIAVKIFDEIHAQEKFTLNVLPADADDAVEEIPEEAIKGPKPCTAEEKAAFAKMSGSFKSYRMNVTIGGSCEQSTGTYKVAEWCEGVDETGNPNTPRVTGTLKGRMIGRSLSVTYEQPASPNGHPARKGSGSCSSNSDRTFSCSGFGCQNEFKRQ
ncbi:MAG TPA: hypothetical protein VFZ40_08335 [Pyrinomonadaceae bacterium]